MNDVMLIQSTDKLACHIFGSFWSSLNLLLPAGWSTYGASVQHNGQRPGRVIAHVLRETVEVKQVKVKVAATFDQ